MSDRQDIFEQETYLSFEEGYPERPVSWFKADMLPRVQSLLSGKKLLLDVGCASGYYTKEFVTFIKRVVGVDYAHNRIKYAKEHFESNDLKFIHSRVDQLKVDKQFDAMFTSMVFQHMPLDIKMQSFENLAALASDDCLFLMYDFNSNQEDIGNGWVEPVSPQWLTKHIKGWQVKSCKPFCNEYQTPDSMIWEYQLIKSLK
jgi:2-polyprenyl-3-methyl-5-hydroxy-6-metoxy-1,4-benzoquinol methylase